MSNNLIIVTTAVIRPDLHNIAFNSYKKFLKYLNKINIKFIINIDYVESLNFDKEIDYLSLCKKNIKNYLKEYKNIDIEFILNNKGCFTKAVQKLISKIKKYNSFTVMWLEDDWIYEEEENIFYEILPLIFSNKSIHLSMTNSVIGNFNPSFYSNKMVQAAFKDIPIKLDPERHTRKCIIKSILVEQKLCHIITLILDNSIKEVKTDLKSYEKFNNDIYRLDRKYTINYILTVLNKLDDNNLTNTFKFYSIPINSITQCLPIINSISNNDYIYIRILNKKFSFNDIGRDWLKLKNIKKIK